MPAKYSLTDEHHAQLKPWADRWIANALNTTPLTDTEREHAKDAVEGFYRAANLTPPPRERIIYAPSPLVATLAAGFAAWIWHCRKSGTTANVSTHVAIDAATDDAIDAAIYSAPDAATSNATDAAVNDTTHAATRNATGVVTHAAIDTATDAATRAATDAATRAATSNATGVVTHAATYAATDTATYAATYAATNDATRSATDAAIDAATDAAIDAAIYSAPDAATNAATSAAIDEATYAATDEAIDATRAATSAATDVATNVAINAAIDTATYTAIDEATPFLLCAQKAWRMRSGGAFWSGWVAFISFFRHVVKLPIDYSKWQHYETLTELSGWRFMHAEFCILTERPVEIHRNADNRAHNADGPALSWPDGWAVWSLNGVNVPADLSWIVTTPAEQLDPAKIMQIENVDVRREAVRKAGVDRMLDQLGSRILDTATHSTADGTAHVYELHELTLPGAESKSRALKMRNPSIGIFHVEFVHPRCATVNDALGFRATGSGEPADWRGYTFPDVLS